MNDCDVDKQNNIIWLLYPMTQEHNSTSNFLHLNSDKTATPAI